MKKAARPLAWPAGAYYTMAEKGGTT